MTRTLAERLSKPWLHIDLRTVSKSKAAEIVGEWLERNYIGVLNVAGSRASEDPEMYQDVLDLLDAVIHSTGK